ncbi:amidohydrolase family protein [Candidatus Palauibacter sp.]|uniref:amidohydrolase family protein n=1 Tax=Candidatus Palauibacter sp. TaxID=3101350 RepID=UPI003B01DCDE
MRFGRAGAAVVIMLGAAGSLAAQERRRPPPVPPDNSPPMTIEAYEPHSTLVVPENPVPRAGFPFVDVHLHLDATMSQARLDQLVRDMDALNLAVGVNLSGGSGPRLARQVEAFEAAYPGRFVVFANVDFGDIDAPEFGALAAARLEADVESGARGLKIFKSLGLSITDAAGERVPVDDPRLDPIWAKAGELGIPVLIHSADPAEFWEPMDANNERWLELRLRPRRRQTGPSSFEQVLGEQLNMFRRHPETTFIAAHLAWLGHDLGRLGRTLDEIPNMNVGLGAVIYEPGRQPRFAREFFINYQDRILMGKDSWAPDEYPTYFRVLETSDEYFPYYRKYHAFWRMYGLDLPDEVLRKVYFENALRIIPGIDRSRFP